MKNWKGFERAVAKMVVDTFKDYGITNKDCFRTPQSGGHRYASQTDPGDLVVSPKLRKLFPFKVECKAWKRVELYPLWLPFDAHKKAWKFSEWLGQVCRDENVKLHPLLVFQSNGQPIFCCVPLDAEVNLRGRTKLRISWNERLWYVLLFVELLEAVRCHLGSDIQ